jgi:hypothetical protein
MSLEIEYIDELNGIKRIGFATNNNKYVKQTIFKYDDRRIYESLVRPGYNSSVIPTGEHYNLFCITIDNNHRSVQKFNKYCKKYGFNRKTLTIRTMSDGYHYFFRLNDRQKEGLRDSDLSNIRLFNLDIEPKYNGQYVYGPTMIIFDDKTFIGIRNQIIESSEIQILPDFLYNEIIHHHNIKLAKLNKILKTANNKKLVKRSPDTSLTKTFKKFIIDNDLDDTMDDNIIEKIYKFIDHLNPRSSILPKNYFIIKFILERLKETDNYKDQIKGTYLRDKYNSFVDKKYPITYVYSLFKEAGLKFLIVDGSMWFRNLEFRYPDEDYDELQCNSSKKKRTK